MSSALADSSVTITVDALSPSVWLPHASTMSATLDGKQSSFLSATCRYSEIMAIAASPLAPSLR